MNKFKHSKIIEIDNYKNIFNRASQNYKKQIKTQNIILAKKKNNFIYSGSELCNDYGNEKFFYAVTIMNCIYDCEYCFLKGMYPSPNIVIFMNLEDYITEFKRVSEDNRKVLLSLSYESDIIAFENVFNGTAFLINEIKDIKNITFELRTKSNLVHILNIKKIPENIIFSWTLSPYEITKKFERFSPSLGKRINDINYCLKKGFRVRICIDPIVYTDSFIEIYGSFIKNIREKIVNYNQIEDFSIGTFRMPGNYFKKIRNIYPKSSLINYPFENKDGYFQYNESKRNKMIKFVYEELKRFIPENKIKVYK